MGRKRILVVENDELISALKGTFLLERGVDLLLAGNGREAFELIETEDPDLVFLDPELEELSGLECCEIVKKDPILKVTPIIAVLPNGGGHLSDCCRELFDDLLFEPIEKQKLLSLCCKYLGVCERPNRRRLVQLPVQFHSKGRRRRGITQDISIGGFFLETKHLVPVGTEFEMDADFPGLEQSISFLVRVAWVNHPEWVKKDDFPYGLGLAILSKPETINEFLEEFCRQD